MSVSDWSGNPLRIALVIFAEISCCCAACPPATFSCWESSRRRVYDNGAVGHASTQTNANTEAEIVGNVAADAANVTLVTAVEEAEEEEEEAVAQIGGPAGGGEGPGAA
jgi:hypothetical protein